MTFVGLVEMSRIVEFMGKEGQDGCFTGSEAKKLSFWSERVELKATRGRVAI